MGTTHKKQMTIKDIIYETVEFYENNPRSVERVNGYTLRCKYYMEENGRELMCAVGRCLYKTKAKSLTDEDMIASMRIKQGDFKKKYRGHSLSFWNELQMLHDNDYFWDEDDFGNTLSKRGEEHVKNLIKMFS